MPTTNTLCTLSLLRLRPTAHPPALYPPSPAQPPNPSHAAARACSCKVTITACGCSARCVSRHYIRAQQMLVAWGQVQKASVCPSRLQPAGGVSSCRGQRRRPLLLLLQLVAAGGGRRGGAAAHCCCWPTRKAWGLMATLLVVLSVLARGRGPRAETGQGLQGGRAGPGTPHPHAPLPPPQGASPCMLPCGLTDL